MLTRYVKTYQAEFAKKFDFSKTGKNQQKCPKDIYCRSKGILKKKN